MAGLIGGDTVKTRPTNTVDAWGDNGVAAADTVAADVQSARSLFGSLADRGLDFESVTDQLLIDGVRQFEQAFAALLDDLQQKVPGAARQSGA